MYFISIRTLDWQLKKAIYSQSLTKEELEKISEGIREKQKQLQKLIIAITIFVAILFVIFIVMGITRGMPFALPIMLGMMVTVPIIYFICYITQIWILKIQYNKAIRKNYNDFFDELKV